MNEEELNELKLKMSLEVPNQPTVIKTQLPLDNDTSFDIYFDIFNGERKKYLYIKLIENSAVAPFIIIDLIQLKNCETLIIYSWLLIWTKLENI